MGTGSKMSLRMMSADDSAALTGGFLRLRGIDGPIRASNVRFFEGEAILIDRLLACHALPAANSRVDMHGVKLDSESPSPGAFGSQNCGSTAEKWVQYNIASMGAIEDCVRH
jgi:hypothetical protein